MNQLHNNSHQYESLSEKLKNLLDQMNQEEFDKEWSKITSLNLESLSFEDAIEFFSEKK